MKNIYNFANIIFKVGLLLGSSDRSPASTAKLTFQDETTAAGLMKQKRAKTETSTANKPLLRLDLTSATTLPPPEEFSQQPVDSSSGISPRHTCGKNGDDEVNIR